MSNSTLIYRIGKETDNTYLRSGNILTGMAREAGYVSLYNLTDKNYFSRTLLFLYMFILKMYKSWDDTPFPISIDSLQSVLGKVQSVHQKFSVICELDGIANGGIFGGNYCDCSHTDTVVTTPTTQVPVYYTASDINSLPTSNEIIGWNTLNVSTGENITIPFQNYNSAPKFLKFAELATEPIKTNYYFSDDDRGDFGVDSTWNAGQIVGIYRVYMPNYQTQTSDLSVQFKVATTP